MARHDNITRLRTDRVDELRVAVAPLRVVIEQPEPDVLEIGGAAPHTVLRLAAVHGVPVTDADDHGETDPPSGGGGSPRAA